MSIAAELIEECNKENAHVALDQPEYQKHYDGLVPRFGKTKAGHTEVTDLIAERMARKYQVETYLLELRGRKPLTEFRNSGWLAMMTTSPFTARMTSGGLQGRHRYQSITP